MSTFLALVAQLTDGISVTGILMTSQAALTATVLYQQRRITQQDRDNKKCWEDRAEIWRYLGQPKRGVKKD